MASQTLEDSEEEPSLGGNDGNRSARLAKLEAALKEASRKICLPLRVLPLAVVSKCSVLFSASKVRHVGDDKSEVPCQKFSRFRDALGRHGQFMETLITYFLTKGLREQRLELSKAAYQEVFTKVPRVDKAPKNVSLIEEIVELLHSASCLLVVPG
jgi:hypothetical protein